MRATGFASIAAFAWTLTLVLVPSRASVAQNDDTETATLPASSTETTERGNDFSRPAHLVVVRFSAAMLESQLNPRIDVTAPVSDVVLGAPVTGVARMVGKPRVELTPSADQARFNVIFTGTVYSRTVCQHGPATIHGHSITRFTATKEVIYEPGKGFRSLPPKVVASSECYTDGIAASRGGIVGRIVQRRASEEVASRHAQLTEIARQRATRRIEAAFERQLNDRIAQLNRSVDFQVQLAGLRTQEGSRRLMARTTPQHLEIADRIDQENSPFDLPARQIASAIASPIEIWIHSSVVPAKVGEALQTIFTNPDQSTVVNALALLPGTLGKEAAAAITTMASENKIAVQNVGDWLVVDLNAKSNPTTAAVQTTVPPTASRR